MTQTNHKFVENLQIVLKDANLDPNSVLAFQKMANELIKEGPEYSISRESFLKFFNELSAAQQKEFLALLFAANGSRSIYVSAQEYKLKLLNGGK